MRSTVLHDVATQLPLTEFLIGCIFSNDPLDRQNFDRQSPSSVQDDIGSVSPPLHPDIVTTCTLTRSSLDRTLAPRALLQPPPGLEQFASPSGLAIDAHLRTPHGIPCYSGTFTTPATFSYFSHGLTAPACTTHVGTHHARSATTGKRSASTALAGTHNLADTDPRAGTVLFLNHEPSFFLWSILVNPNLKPHISDQFLVCTGNTDLAILLNKDTFEPDPIVLTFKADSTSKGTWGMVLLIVRGLLRRPSLSGSPTVTFCSVHIHNVVAKKRDASTDLLQRLRGYMREHNVDFIGGDFNMSAFSTVVDDFTDEEFSAPGNSLLWGLAALEEPNRECAGFLIMPKRPYEWRVHSHGCYKFDNAVLGLGPRDQSAHLPVFFHLRTTNLPGPSSVMRSEQAQRRRFERRHNKERVQRRRTSTRPSQT